MTTFNFNYTPSLIFTLAALCINLLLYVRLDNLRLGRLDYLLHVFLSTLATAITASIIIYVVFEGNTTITLLYLALAAWIIAHSLKHSKSMGDIRDSEFSHSELADHPTNHVKYG